MGGGGGGGGGGGPEDPVCYAPDTMILTPGGPRRADALRPGDLVQTMDRGPRAIRWAHKSVYLFEGAACNSRPVLIGAGALGPGVPERDLTVSPQHRVLVGGQGQLPHCFDVPALAPAKALIALPGIRLRMGMRRMSWVHIACDRHEVIVANGCYAESLLLGPMVLASLSDAQRNQLRQCYDTPARPGAALNGPPALPLLSVTAARRRLSERQNGIAPGRRGPDSALMEPGMRRSS